MTEDDGLSFIYKMTLTVLGVALFAYLDRARPRIILASCICGALTFIASELTEPWLGNGFLTYLISASVTCASSELGARLMRTPTTVILLPAIIPLVPGSLLYKTVRALITGKAELFRIYGTEALNATAGIAIAIASVSAVARFMSAFIKKLYDV